MCVITEKNKSEDEFYLFRSDSTLHESAIRESSRFTENKAELSEDEKFIIERKLKIVRDSIGTNTVFRFIYFVPDKTKHGGAYVPYDGAVKKIDLCQNHLVLTDCTVIDIDQIVGIESDLFSKYEW